ncbi:MAG: hypothetical protein SPJ13_01580 [Bacteroidales bacterium]|nr:hypothetical protein [Bacteroidales bacterium]
MAGGEFTRKNGTCLTVSHATLVPWLRHASTEKPLSAAVALAWCCFGGLARGHGAGCKWIELCRRVVRRYKEGIN